MSAVLFLMRVDRPELMAALAHGNVSTTQAQRRFSGVGCPWYHIEFKGIRLHFNGVVALAEGERVHEVLDPMSATWDALSGKWPVVAKAHRRVLVEQIVVTKVDFEALEYYSGAVELLTRLMTFALSRPGTTAREIVACERWLHGRSTQYLTGRGALRNVVLPWRTWLDRYEYLLRNLEGELEELELPSAGPLRDLSSGLGLLSTERDRNSIVREYRTRLEDLTDACNRVAAEIGVVGTFGSLAVVPFESTLGLFFLVPVVLAGSAYFGGYSLARALLIRPKQRRVKGKRWLVRRKRAAALTGKVETDAPTLSDLFPGLRTQPVHIVASSRLSAADTACGLEIRHQLLERTKCDDPLAAITLGTRDGREGIRVVLGGPLVRSYIEPFVAPACDLTDSRGNGWEIVAGDRRVVHCDDDETVGCCVVGPDGRTLFIFGVRDAGTVAVTQWLTRALDDEEVVNASWIAVRRGSNGQPEELMRG